MSTQSRVPVAAPAPGARPAQPRLGDGADTAQQPLFGARPAQSSGLQQRAAQPAAPAANVASRASQTANRASQHAAPRPAIGAPQQPRPAGTVPGQPTLRPYQRAADAAITRDHTRFRSVLLVMATGCGKTVSFCERVRRARLAGERSLIIAHRDELIRQPRRKLEQLGIYADVEKGKERASLNAKVVIASVQTLKGPRLKRFPRDHFQHVIVDEAHHSVASGYRTILDHFDAAKVLGVTATPIRADGEALGVDGGGVYETVAYRYEIRQAIREGYLVPIRARRIVLEGVDLSAVKTRAGDLAQDQLSKQLDTERAIAGVVVPLLELAGDRPTVVFGVDVAHAERLAAALNDRRPGCARSISGATDDTQRERLLAEYERGDFQFLTNCQLLTEGWDAPHTSCVAIVRPTKSWALFVQMAGRGTRLSPETNKRDLLLLNFTGRAGQHRLVGPADCLAGSEQALDAIGDDLRGELDRLLGTQTLDLERGLAKAIEDLQQRRSTLAAAALVRYHAEHIDPFVGPDPLTGDGQVALAWADRQPTDAQRAALKRQGITVSQLPPSFSMADAAKLLTRIAMRRRAGLCSLRQAKAIAKGTGIDTRAMTYERAAELCAMLREAGWRPHALRHTPEWRAAHPSEQDEPVPPAETARVLRSLAEDLAQPADAPARPAAAQRTFRDELVGADQDGAR